MPSALAIWFSPPSRGVGRGDSDRRRHERAAHAATLDIDAAHPDAAFVTRIRTGDEAAFTAMFRAHYPQLVGYVGSLIGDPDEASEIICDLFARLYLARDRFAPSGPIRAYLFRSARNRALNAVRDQQTAQRNVMAVRAELSTAIQSSTDADGDELDPILEMIDRLFAELPPRAREAASLRWRQGMSLDEIAQALGIAKPSVSMLLSRTLKLLRQRLAPLRARSND